MFSSFDSLNTPGVKVWDYSKTPGTSPGQSRIYLEDDCASIQLFLTGGSTSAVIIQLPLSSVPGKTITFRNERIGQSSQTVTLLDSSFSSSGYALGQGTTYTFVCVPQINGYVGTNPLGPVMWVALQGVTSIYSQSYYGSVLSGTSNLISAPSAVIAGGTSNTASGTQSFVGGGTTNTASGSQSAVVGGSSNLASGQYAGVLTGASCQASTTGAVVVGGSSNIASGSYSSILSGVYGTTRGISGAHAIPATVQPIQSLNGATQGSVLLLGVQTTDATPTALRSNTSAASTTNQLILPNNAAYLVKGSVIANVTGGGNTSAWTFDCAIKRGATAASTAIVGAVSTNLIAQDAGASTWTIAVTADTTNGGLRVTVTGQGATTIRWVCKLESTEVTY